MKDRDSRLLYEAYDLVVESGDPTLLNTLANVFGNYSVSYRISLSKNQRIKLFKKHLIDSGIANDSSRMEFLSRDNNKGRKARDELFAGFINDLKSIYGEEPEPAPETETELDGFPRDDETLPPPEYQEPAQEEPDDESWLDALKRGKLRIPRWPGINFKDKDGNTIN